MKCQLGTALAEGCSIIFALGEDFFVLSVKLIILLLITFITLS